jgi:hypothetical protein
LIGSLAWGIGTVILALGATWARKLGYIEAESFTRLVIGTNGLIIARFGNRMPKAIVPNVGAQGHAARPLLNGAEWAFVRWLVGVCPDSSRSRMRRGDNRNRSDARLLPLTAFQGKGCLTGGVQRAA